MEGRNTRTQVFKATADTDTDTLLSNRFDMGPSFSDAVMFACLSLLWIAGVVVYLITIKREICLAV